MISREHATKRIPVRPDINEELQRLREPGQTSDDALISHICEGNRYRLYNETDRIMSRGRFVELPREL